MTLAFPKPVKAPKRSTTPAPKPAKPAHVDAVRNSARGEDCTLRLEGVCNFDPETTILAHLRLFGSAGVGQKPPDFAAVYACEACHSAIDRRGSQYEGTWGFEDLLRALMLTHRRLYAKGLLHIGRE